MNRNDIVIANVATGSVVIEPGATFESALAQYDTSKAPAASLLANRFFDGDNELGLANFGDVLQPGTMITVYSRDAFDNGIEGNCEGCSDLSVECSDPANHRPQTLVEGQHTAEAPEMTLQSILDAVERGEVDFDNDPLGIGADAFVDQQYDLSKLPENIRSVVAPLDTNNDGFIDAMEAVAKLEQAVEAGSIVDRTGLIAAQSAQDNIVEGQSEQQPADDDGSAIDDGEDNDLDDEADDGEAVEQLIEMLEGGDVVDPDAPVVEGQHSAALAEPPVKQKHTGPDTHADAFDEDNQSYEIAKLPESEQAQAREVDADGDGFISFDEYMNWLVNNMAAGPAADSDLN